MVEWLAGNRIRGTSTERTTGAGFNPVPAGVNGVGGWKEIGRTTLGSAGQKVLINSIADKRYLMILTNMLANGTNDLSCNIRFNEDIGSNYARRDSFDGAADGTAASITAIATTGGMSIDNQVLGVHYVSNLSAKEKLLTGNYNLSNATGAGTAPNRGETVGKWANTSTVIDDVEQVTGDAGFGTGSEVVVLGWDPADTHTTNFWEELASVELGGTSSTLDSGTITAKKYLWVQLFNAGNSSGEEQLTFNSDTGSNYNRRFSVNGAADATTTSAANIENMFTGGTAIPKSFCNAFIINNSANEKLVMAHNIYVATAGAANAPARMESANKWANTSAQITKLTFTSSSGVFAAGSFLKVWGSD